MKYFVESDVVEYIMIEISLQLGQDTDRWSFIAKVKLESVYVMLWIFIVPERPNVEVFSANMLHY